MRGRHVFSVLHRPAVVLPLPDITQMRLLTVLARTPRSPRPAVYVIRAPATVIRTVVRALAVSTVRAMADLIPVGRAPRPSLARGPPRSV